MPTTKKEKIESNELMVLVHPGSLCGSYWFNGGTQEGLDALLAEVNEFDGQIVVIDNELKNEIESDNEVSEAYHRAEFFFSASGSERALRIAAGKIARGWKKCGVTKVIVTGAWVGEHGCASCVAERLSKLMNCPVEISPNAARG